MTKLCNLRTLIVSDNALTSVTKHISALTCLEVLDLQGNDLEMGGVVDSSMRSLTGLTQLVLGRNKFNQFPEWILALKNLRHLDIQGNPEIAEIPEEIGSVLVRLQTLNLNNAGIHDLPKSVSKLTSLTILNLGANYLEDLPKGLRRLTLLKALNISHNEFVDFPPSLLKLQHLESFVTGGNPKRIEIPKTLFVLAFSVSMLFTTNTFFRVRKLQFRSDHCENPDLIVPNVFLGSFECARNKAFLKARNVTHIISVINTYRPLYPEDFWYHVIPVEDVDATNLLQHFEETHKFIDQAIDSGAAVLVHCAAGISRSATIVTSYVMKKQQMSAQQALAFVMSKRGIICPNMGFRRQLEEYEKQLKKSRCLIQ